jgi:hypothetical protein
MVRGVVLPRSHIGSSRNEPTGANVIRRAIQRKRNQPVMHHGQLTSISGKRKSENLAGEDGRERSEGPGEGPREPVSPRIAAPLGRSPVARTLRARAATSPAR